MSWMKKSAISLKGWLELGVKVIATGTVSSGGKTPVFYPTV